VTRSFSCDIAEKLESNDVTESAGTDALAGAAEVAAGAVVAGADDAVALGDGEAPLEHAAAKKMALQATAATRGSV
jgi:hypothetical protein